MHDPAAPAARTSVLFVCLGNICRSPLAEGIFRTLVAQRGLEDRFDIDSAGTGGWHAGEPPDTRAMEVAARNGVRLTSRARQVTRTDLERFDWVIAMDRDNLTALEGLATSARAQSVLHLLRAFDPAGGATDNEVPDPYYGGPSGFVNVYEMVDRSCAALLAHILAEDS
jgi:protein-tyrosine phosphatase